MFCIRHRAKATENEGLAAVWLTCKCSFHSWQPMPPAGRLIIAHINIVRQGNLPRSMIIYMCMLDLLIH